MYARAKPNRTDKPHYNFNQIGSLPLLTLQLSLWAELCPSYEMTGETPLQALSIKTGLEAINRTNDNKTVERLDSVEDFCISWPLDHTQVSGLPDCGKLPERSIGSCACRP